MSSRASDITRQLSFAGIAIIWIYKTGTSGTEKLIPSLILPAVLIIITLVLDLLQYLIGTLLWKSYGFFKENKGIECHKKFKAPGWINWPIWTLWILKIITIICSYILILVFLFSVLIP